MLEGVCWHIPLLFLPYSAHHLPLLYRTAGFEIHCPLSEVHLCSRECLVCSRWSIHFRIKEGRNDPGLEVMSLWVTLTSTPNLRDIFLCVRGTQAIWGFLTHTYFLGAKMISIFRIGCYKWKTILEVI